MHIRKYTQIMHIRHATYVPFYVFLQVLAFTEIWIATFTGDLMLILSMNGPIYCEATWKVTGDVKVANIILQADN
jgi:hypothetical protein